MPATSNRADLLGPEWTILYLGLLAIALLAVWIATHFAKRFLKPSRVARLVAFVPRAALATASLWAFFQILARALYLDTPWSLWVAAAVSGIAIELAITLYDHERSIVTAGRARLLITLRIAALLTLTVILLQPILARESQRRLRREIVILLDDSASMQLSDRQLTASEKLKIAALFKVPATQRDATLTDVQRGLQLLDSQLAAEARALEPLAGVSDSAANSLISSRIAPLSALLQDAEKRIAGFVQTAKKVRSSISSEHARPLENIEDRISTGIRHHLEQARTQLANTNYLAASAEIQNVSRQVSYILANLPAEIEQFDLRFYNALSPAERAQIDAAASTTRGAIARQALQRGDFVQQLGDDYQLRFIRFAREAEDIDGEAWLETGHPAPASEDQSNFRRATDLTAALESILEKIPSGSLAGIILLSDGRHNGTRPIEDAARRLGLQQAPVCSVVIGSSIGPKDAGILDVRVPDAIYLDDRAIVQADLKLDGLSGETITISLLKGNELLESKEIEVANNSLRTTLRFAHTPDQIGISKYTINASLTPGETFVDNNRWDFEVAITDDRTNVLIIESYPRWEFRYLRNLFHAREKSVHLQYVLLNPDEITDTPPPPIIAASADRKFGDSEATALPADREQWLKFDAIIVGDVPPTAIDETTWGHIQHCVSERATLLIAIAGARYMPHAFTSPTLKALLPIRYAEAATTQIDGPEPAYRLRLTPEGRSSLIMQQSIDPNLNSMIWGSLPPLHWRHAITGVKPGAEVLAYAHPLGSSETRTPTRELQSANALIATQRYALGRVLALNFDRTWRLRYGVGDVYHHKFWGQILRWGTGENLRAGNEFIRLGTDKLSYEPGEKIKITARVTTPDHRPLTSGNVSASIYQRDQLVLRKALTFREDSNGVYETEVGPLPAQGRLRVRIDGDDASRILQSQNLGKVETEFIVEPSRNAIELSELTADPSFLGRLAALSGGSIADPDNAAALRNFLSPPGQIIRERREITLWDNLPLLVVFLACLTAEWIARRSGGLA